MSQPTPIDFWFSIGSLYTYLSVMRLDRIEEMSDVAFRWRPFSLPSITGANGNPAPAKLDYMWRDLERRAHGSLCDFPKRPPYPLKNADLANRIAMVGAAEGWCPEYVRTIYSRWFGLGEDSSEPNVSASLKEIGQDPARVIALARSDAVGRSYDEATAEAKRLGIFGAPTFVTRGDLFWGDDRIEDAVRWHKAGTLQRR